MNSAIDIHPLNLAAAYGLLLFPLAVILWYGIRLVRPLVISVVRMTAQLVFVGLYLQVIFDRNNPWLTLAWLMVMLIVADVSVVRGCRLRWSFLGALFTALVAGVGLPLTIFVGAVLASPNLLEARYVIPIAGMILGNCLRADIIGINRFYQALGREQKFYCQCLAQGATRAEALRPFMQEAFQAAMAPTVATMSTIGLVSLPGMMTGVILGGTDPATAIKYQIAIMLSIFSGTAVTVFLGIALTLGRSLDAYGMPRWLQGE